MSGSCFSGGALLHPSVTAFPQNLPAFKLPEAGPLTVSWKGLSGTPLGGGQLWLTASDGAQVAYVAGSDQNPDASLTTQSVPAGSYFVSLSNDGFSDLTVEVTVTGPGCPGPGGGGSGTSGAAAALVLLAVGGAGVYLLSRRRPTVSPRVPAPGSPGSRGSASARGAFGR